MAIEEKNKINEIVELLKKDGIEAGKAESDKIISEAQQRAKEIINNANREKEKILQETQKDINKIKRSAEANIRMAINQGINQFREAIENTLLQPTIIKSIEKATNIETIKEMIITIVSAYSKAGFETNDLNIILNEQDRQKIKNTILSEIGKQIKNASSIEIIGDKVSKGVKLIQKSGNLSLEFTPESITEVLLSFVRSEFRKIFFEGKK